MLQIFFNQRLYHGQFDLIFFPVMIYMYWCLCLAQGPQHSDTGEAGTCGSSVSSPALYNWANALPIHVLYCIGSLYVS